MSSIHKNLSDYNDVLPDASGMRIGIVIAEWNKEITSLLHDAVKMILLQAKCKNENIFEFIVPGSFELPLGAKHLLETKKPDAVICIGCIVQGETRHFDFICNSVADGIMRLNLDYKIPVIFGVLTTNSMEQAKDRAGGKYGNKGIEAAVTALKMVAGLRN